MPTNTASRKMCASARALPGTQPDLRCIHATFQQPLFLQAQVTEAVTASLGFNRGLSEGRAARLGPVCSWKSADPHCPSRENKRWMLEYL